MNDLNSKEIYMNAQPALRTDSHFLTYALVGLVLINVGRVIELIPFLVGSGVAKIVLAVTLVALFFSRNKDFWSNLFTSKQTKLICSMYFLAILSIPFSVWKGQSFDFVFVGHLKTLLFYALMLIVIDNYDKFKKVNAALVVSLCCLAFATALSAMSVEGRSYATYTYDANDIALVLVTGLPMVYFMILDSRKFKKVVLICLLLLIIFAVMKTVSRGGFLGLIAVALIIFLRDERSMAFKIGVMSLLAIFFFAIAPESYWNRIQTLTNLEEDYNTTVQAGRKEVWSRGIDLMLDNPLFGVGAGAFVTAEGLSHKDAGGKWSAPHNSFIQIGAELGVGGLILFLMLIYSSVRDMINVRKKLSLNPVLYAKYGNMTKGVEIAFYGFCVTGFFLSHAYSPILYFLIALAVVLKRVADNAVK